MNNNKNINLKELGLKDKFLKEYNEVYKEKGYFLGRVIVEYKNLYKIAAEEGEILGEIAGKISFNAASSADYPAVGDWVVIDRLNNRNGNAIIHGILTRNSKFSRKVAGFIADEQIVAANIDTIFISMALNNDFNVRKLERYVSLAWDSGALPIVLLTKSDLCEDIDEKLAQVQEVAIGIDIIVASSLKNEGIEEVKKYIDTGKTVAFLGSSGVGKSTLINLLMGEEKQVTQETRSDDKGRHTTTHRELMIIPTGGVVIDTPGMREIQLLDNSEGIDTSFSDVEELAAQCKFSDCKHKNEPGCAVRKAIESGQLSKARYESYKKLKKEAAHMEKRLKHSQRIYKKKMEKKSGSSKKRMKYKAM